MKKRVSLLLLLALLLTSNLAVAQLVVTTGGTATNLTNAISGQGVIITNETLNCPAGAYGTFTSTGTNLGMNAGILLTTGDASLAVGPNALGSTSACPGTSATDSDLTAIEPQATQDVCTLEFDIIPQCDTLKLNYVFGSEEYPEFVNSSFNDAFGFFVSGPNPAGGNYVGSNIALLPGTTTAVTIDNVNPTTNAGYYVDNTGGATIEYDGFTTVLTAAIPVDQCATYHMKLIIADAGDCSYDSGVFLDFEGLSCPNNDVQVATVVDTAYEGCADAEIQVTRTPATGTLTFNVLTDGTATAGTDYTINNSYTFNNGQGSMNITIPAGADGITEGVETADIIIEYFICGVSVYDTVQIYIVDEVMTTFATTPTTCGACDGSATATVTGGLPPYSFQWDAPAGGGTGVTASNLCPGTYTFTVTDDNGCVWPESVTITNSGGVTLNIASVDETCLGDNDGSITASGAGGTPGYQYSIDGSALQASGSFTGLAPGNYTILIQDAAGCTDQIVVTINPGPVCCTQAPTAAGTDATCNGVCDGTATANPVGAQGTITYDWLLGGASIGQTTQTATGLCAGTYTVEVTDDFCTMTATVTINEPPAVTGVVGAQTDVSCFGAADGTVTITAGGGTPGYTYSINGGAFGAGNAFTGLAGGAHTVTVQDANGCQTTVNVNIVEPPAVTLVLASQTDVSCNGLADGTATVTAGGGVPGYTYSVDGGAFGASNVLTGLNAGAHTITVQDANGCQETVNVTIIEPPVVTGVIASQTDVTCFGANDGSVTITGGGGVPALEYNINGGAFGASNVFTGLAGGAHTVIVQDANGCQATVNVTIVEPPQLTIVIASQVDVTCNGGADGEVTVTGGGGTPALQYSIDGGALGASNNFTGLNAGNHTVMVQDANGCQATVIVNILEPTLVTVTLNGTTDATCGAANGAIDVSGAGGTGALEFSIDGTNFQASGIFNGMAPGAYTVTVQDANGCQNTMVVNIVDLSGLTATILTQVDVTCNGGADGSVTIDASGSAAMPYDYSIDNGVTWQAGSTFAGLAAGSYDVTVQDANGCPFIVNVVITEPPLLTATETITNVTCNAACDGVIDVNATGGTPALEYSLDGTNFQSGNIFTSLCAGPYTVTVRDANGCLFTLNVNITEPLAVTIATTPVDVNCFGACDGSVTITSGGGVAPLEYSLDGTTYVAGNVFANLCAGNHTAYVRDANGCVVTEAFVINEPPVLDITLTSVQDATCGLPNGVVEVNSTGGTPAVQYSIDGITFQAGNIFNGVAPGTYDMIVQDANGCTDTIPATVVDLSGLTGVVGAQVDVSCNGGADGSVTISASGSAAMPYTYSIDGITFTPDSTFNFLAAGPHTVTVEDANGCQFQVPVTINEPDALFVNSSCSPASCNNGCDGEIHITVSGGTPGYEFSFDNGITFTPDSFLLNACSGDYDMIVRDSNGCLFNLTDSVTHPAAVTFTWVSTNSICGGADGTITVTGQGGAGGYEFSIDGGTTWQAGATFTGLAAGTYTIDIRDQFGCLGQGTANVSNDAAPVINSTTFTDATCFGVCDGDITVNATGGTGGLQYSINGGALGPNNVFNGLCAGVYDIMVEDGNGCQVFDQVTISEPADITYTVAITGLTCYQDGTGQIVITAAGGDGNYMYSINGGVAQASNTFSGLAAGNYTILITDGAGCTGGGLEVVTEPAELTMSFAAFDVSCFGACDGNAIVIPAGGTVIGPYAFTWTAAGVGNTANATNLCAGTYTLTVTDDNGCFVDTTFTINEPAPFVVTTSSTTSNCNQADGTATVDNVTGGTGAYTYQWDAAAGSGTNATATNLIPGNYQVTISDGNLCDTTVTINVPNTPGVIASLLASTDATCFQGCDGYAEVTQAGGVAGYTYAWDNGVTTAAANNLCAGNYYCVVTDASGCFDTVFVTINEPTEVMLTVSNDTTICIGGTATLVAYASGGTGPYTFDWNGGTWTGSSISDQPVGQTTYTVVAIDANGCGSAPQTVTVNINPPLSMTISPNDSICPGENANISATASGGNGGPYNFNWTNNDGTGWTFNGDNTNVNPTTSAWYYAAITDGCSTPAVIDSVLIYVHDAPAVTFIADTVAGCEPLTVTFTNTTNPAQLGGSCIWDFGDSSTPVDACGQVTHTYTTAGVYDVTLTVTASYGCTGTTTVNQMINVYPIPTADFSFSPEPATIVDPTIYFEDLSTGAATWDWTFGELGSSNEQNPSFEFPAPGTYPVELIVTSQYGCTSSIMDSVQIDDVFSLYVPNAFTPDGDGVNDVFLPIIMGADDKDYTFFIFNRWGELIWEAHHLDIGWDGMSKGQMSKTDVYVWKINVADAQTNEVHEYVGHVTLLK